MNFTFAYTVDGMQPQLSHFSAGWEPYSLAYFCPHCGEIWARATRLEPLTNRRTGPYFVQQAPCSPCAGNPAILPWEVPGSLLHYSRLGKQSVPITFWAQALEHLPPEILSRDLDMLLNHLERTENGN